MVFPSGENLGNDSSPVEEVRRRAVPPAFETIQISPPYTKQICVCDTSGYLNRRASISAKAIEELMNKSSKQSIRFINSNLTPQPPEGGAWKTLIKFKNRKFASLNISDWIYKKIRSMISGVRAPYSAVRLITSSII